MLQFSTADIARIKERVKEHPEHLEALRAQTAFFFEHGVKVPVGTQSTWIMNFVCPEDSATLRYDYASEFEYVCPVCGKAYLPTTSQAYCSAACRVYARRKSERERKRRKRQNQP